MEKIKVGGITYKVEYKELEADEGIQLGWCKKSQSLIEVNNHNVCEQLQEQTLIHEMTHAIFNESGLDLGDDEEDVVNRMSIVLHQVLKDNDFTWLREDDNEETHTIIAGGKEYLLNSNNELVEVD